MFYGMIERARDGWFRSERCTVRGLVKYIETRGQMRDAQVAAIKTYLYLKIACGCRPLSALFSEGAFNTADIGELPLPDRVKEYLRADPAVAALLEYATLKNDAGEQISPQLVAQITTEPDSIDYQKVFRDIFYGVSYTDYLFSLPMGAGKTYLMAAFIYLDLYFALNEPENPAFAHNFILFAPSGLKSSVVPSLKTIQKFDPTWVIPEPAASRVKRAISFEVLDQTKSAKKSNRAKNPNVQKIASHQPLDALFGLVAVTNAEKVIYDRLEEEDMQLSLFKREEQEQIRQSRELREIIGKIPGLSVFIDEVQHAPAGGKSKLRTVVERWTASRAVNSVVGFSGTPYLEKAEKVSVTDKLSVASAEITNVVYYYPLAGGVGNFLKHPVIKIADIPSSERIIENGTRAFLDAYKDTVYPDGTTAKLAIYCGTIAKLEELVSPIVSRIVQEYGLPADCVLKFYRRSESKDKTKKRYTAPADSQMLFDTLDQPISPVRVILLAQIGKEGWDCRSLTGVILSQEGDCPRNMVLQTSCRCLRQVTKGQPETALIYLNRDNGEILDAQLRQKHHITLKEFGEADHHKFTLHRYDRTGYLKLPKVEFYQLKVSYSTTVTRPADPASDLPWAHVGAVTALESTTTTDLTMRPMRTEIHDEERGDVPAVFDRWLYQIARSSFWTLPLERLQEHREALWQVFKQITYEPEEGRRYFSSRYDRAAVEANIRKAFCEKRTYATQEELVPEEASLLNIANFQPVIYTDFTDVYYPKQDAVENIVLDDQGKLKMKPDIQAAIQALEADDSPANRAIAETLRKQNSSHPQKDKSFHYLPYHTDSGFEHEFMDEMLPFLDDPTVKALGLELYYNGDKTLTEFQIRCYKSVGGRYRYIGMYTPDFLILQRKGGKIHKALIVETKGDLYANDPKFQDKRTFTEGEFIRQNNAKFGYARFEYLYLEYIQSKEKRLQMVRNVVQNKVREFFKEDIDADK